MTGYPILFIGDTVPGGSPSDGWIWVDTLHKVIKTFEGYVDGSWVEKSLDIPVDIHFKGKIKVDDLEGKTVAIPYTKLGGGTGTLQFHDGILVNNT